MEENLFQNCGGERWVFNWVRRVMIGFCLACGENWCTSNQYISICINIYLLIYQHISCPAKKMPLVTLNGGNLPEYVLYKVFLIMKIKHNLLHSDWKEPCQSLPATPLSPSFGVLDRNIVSGLVGYSSSAP